MNALDLHTALDRDADLVGEPSPDLLDQLVRRRQHQRRQRAGILAVAAAVVVIGGGIPAVSSLATGPETAPADQVATTPSATTEAAPTTSAEPAPSSSAELTTEAPPTADPEPAALVLGPDGLGPLKLGMSLSEAEVTGMVEPFRNEPISDRCLWRSQLSDAAAGTSTVFHSSTLGIATIDVNEGVLTPEGIGIGSPLADVDAAYPGWRSTVVGGGGPSGRAYPAVPGNDQAVYRISFGSEGVVDELTLQYAMQDCYE